jgi:hypothetical protein
MKCRVICNCSCHLKIIDCLHQALILLLPVAKCKNVGTFGTSATGGIFTANLKRVAFCAFFTQVQKSFDH